MHFLYSVHLSELTKSVSVDNQKYFVVYFTQELSIVSYSIKTSFYSYTLNYAEEKKV
jgi:hypothetical protein